ncbi:thioredoxin-disulfide reductase [Candidatus Babeliales bacterium]|nr:thioredoxin-disulfide reductase [Candidatus Babeliales bacterium]
MPQKVVIIGSGPAGLTAGIYTSRAKLEPILIEGMQPGGQLTTTNKVENWPGDIEIMGPELMMNIKKQAKHNGCQIISDTVEKVDFSSKPYKIFTKNGKEFEAESVIIATGATHKKLHIPGEEKFWGKGVSVCATCDAPFFKDKEIIVVGGGNSAVYEIYHLANFAKKITVIHILDKLTATDPIKDEVLKNPKVEFIFNSTLTEIKGDDQKVTEVAIQNQKTKETKTLKINGIFIAIGLTPNTDIFKGQIDIDNHGFIVLTKNTKTSKNGIFAAGDVADYRYKQAITAAGLGCMAAIDCQKYLSKK